MELLCSKDAKRIKCPEMQAQPLSVTTPLSERELQIQIQHALTSKFTGQIRLIFLNNRTETVFVVQGQVRQVYIRNHRVPDSRWETPISRYGAGTLTTESLPARALMFRKILLEDIRPTHPQPARTIQLRTMFDLAEHNPGPTLFHIRWEQAEGFVLVAGKGIPLRHAVLLAPGGSWAGSDALEQILGWGEAQCSVTVRRGNIQNQAWLEVHLNILFERYCAMILNHYGQLTGSVMVQAVVRKISALAAETGWNIEPLRTAVQDTTLLPAAADMGEAYRRLFAVIRGQIEPVIGSALTHGIFKQAQDSSRDVYRHIAEVFELPGKVAQ